MYDAVDRAPWTVGGRASDRIHIAIEASSIERDRSTRGVPCPAGVRHTSHDTSAVRAPVHGPRRGSIGIARLLASKTQKVIENTLSRRVRDRRAGWHPARGSHPALHRGAGRAAQASVLELH